MKTFEYRGYDSSGRTERGLIEADSAKTARELLARRGILADKIRTTERAGPLCVTARAALYRELGALLHAGLPLMKALDLLIASPEERRGTRLLLAGVRDAVREGRGLAAALSTGCRSVTEFEIAILRAAERSARVDEMLEGLATFMEEQESAKERARSALIYPALVLSVGVCVAAIMLVFLAPRARDLSANSKAALPAITVWMAGIARWAPRVLPVLTIVCGTAVGVLRRRLRSDVVARRRFDHFLFGLPLVGRGYTLLARMRFARTMAILLSGGVPVMEALSLAARATGSAWLAAIAETEAENIRHGSNLSDAVGRMPPLASWLPGLIRVGEAGGGLDRLLDGAGQRASEQWTRFVTRALTVLEPVAILLIGCFVLAIALSILLPVLSLTRSLTPS